MDAQVIQTVSIQEKYKLYFTGGFGSRFSFYTGGENELIGVGIDDMMTAMWEWIFENFWTLIRVTMNSFTLIITGFGEGFFQEAINICTGFVLQSPANSMPDAWNYVKQLSQNGIVMGLAEDLVVVFFLISLIDYSVTVRNRMDLEDIIKMFLRMLVADWLVCHFVEIIEIIWGIASVLVTQINPSNVVILETVELTDEVLMTPIFVLVALVYAIVLILLGFKVITTFFEKFLWVYLAIPFGGPAFATVVGTGQWNSTAKAYTKYIVATALEFVTFALIVVLLGQMNGAFRTLMNGWITAGSGLDIPVVKTAMSYLANLCFAGIATGTLTKIDGQVGKMLAL